MTALQHNANETGAAARAALDRSRTAVDPALRAAVEDLPPRMRQIAGYHLGWSDERGNPVEGDRGKAIRPAMVLLTARAVGGAESDAVPGAVAVELVHNFSLLHDDVMDGDTSRRHRPTAWAVFGTGPAILAGDVLLTLANDVLTSCEHPCGAEAARVLSGSVLDLIGGQSSDLSFQERHVVELAECQRMAKGKTGALLGGAAALGALLGGGSAEQVARMRAFGGRLGLAFQHVDDLLGIWGDPGATGKPVFSDLRTRKKTLPVVAALNSGTPAGRELTELYRREQPLSGRDLAHAAELVAMAGGRTWSQQQADEMLSGALRDLRRAALDGSATEELAALAGLMTNRDR